MRHTVFVFPIVLMAGFVGLKLTAPLKYEALIQEDAIVEYSQAAAYMLSAFIALGVSIKCMKNTMIVVGVLYGALAVGLLFTAMEEISWGQRIFNISVPRYFMQNNLQNEISLHNLRLTQPLLMGAYILVGAYGAFAWLLVRVFLARSKDGFCHIVNYFIPEWFLSLYFLPCFLLYATFEYIWIPSAGTFIVWRDQEPVELLLSLGFLFFVISSNRRLKICSARNRI